MTKQVTEERVTTLTSVSLCTHDEFVRGNLVLLACYTVFVALVYIGNLIIQWSVS